MTEISQETMMFKREPEKREVADTIKEVYAALEEKGYNPVDQLAGYSSTIWRSLRLLMTV